MSAAYRSVRSAWPSLKERLHSGALPIGRAIGRLGISANALTVMGLVLNVIAAVIVGTGWTLAGGIMFLLASAFDTLDGAVARATNTASSFGAFFDSVIDRYSESAMFIGLLALFASRQQFDIAVICAVALIGSLMVSYARARAEGLGVDCEVGILQRTERVVVLGVALVFADLLLVPVIWLLAIVTNATVVQRIIHVWRKLRV
jgi:CDP-diacylglycerol--glycerol-3-phosphate 3-phosphatidyltransferase